MRIRILFLTLVLLSHFAWAGYYSTPFDQAKEFPAYLAEGDAKAVRSQLEKTMKTIFSRVTVPVSTAPGKVESKLFFKEADSIAKELGFGRKLKIYPSGGLVRNVMSDLYEVVHQAKQAHPKKSVVDILAEYEKALPREISHTQVRGVMSDFDVLIDGLTDSELKAFNSRLEGKLTEFEKAQGMYKSKSGAGVDDLKAAIVIKPDFKDLHAQTMRAAKQGGLESDFIVFDMEKGSLKDPFELGWTAADLKENTFLEKFKGGVSRLLNGNVIYHPSYTGQPAEAKQWFRSLRTLTESPWTQIDASSRQAFAGDASRISGADRAANEQIDKGMRNSRFAGAHNRLFRLKDSASPIDQTIAKVVEKTKSFKMFVQAGVDPKKIPIPDFIKAALIEAPETVYHGTKGMQNLLSISRNGMVLSTGANTGTTAVYGNGLYTSDKKSTALAYAREEGASTLIELKVDKNARVLDLSKIPQNMKSTLQAEAKAMGVDLNLYLQEKYGVQIVRDGHYMVVDSQVFTPKNKNIGDIIKLNVEALAASENASFRQVMQTRALAEYAVMAGEPGAKKLISSVDWDSMVLNSFGKTPLLDLRELELIDQSFLSPSAQQQLKKKAAGIDAKALIDEEIVKAMAKAEKYTQYHWMGVSELEDLAKKAPRSLHTSILNDARVIKILEASNDGFVRNNMLDAFDKKALLGQMEDPKKYAFYKKTIKSSFVADAISELSDPADIRRLEKIVRSDLETFSKHVMRAMQSDVPEVRSFVASALNNSDMKVAMYETLLKEKRLGYFKQYGYPELDPQIPAEKRILEQIEAQNQLSSRLKLELKAEAEAAIKARGGVVDSASLNEEARKIVTKDISKYLSAVTHENIDVDAIAKKSPENSAKKSTHRQQMDQAMNSLDEAAEAKAKTQRPVIDNLSVCP